MEDNQPVYGATNESLQSIVSGMSVKPSDHVLSIGGAGDQAFALLEYVRPNKGGRVEVIDPNQSQVDYILSKVAELKRGDFKAFAVCREMGELKFTAGLLKKLFSGSYSEDEFLHHPLSPSYLNELLSLPTKEKEELVNVIDSCDESKDFLERINDRNNYFASRLQALRTNLCALNVRKGIYFP